MSRVLSVLKSFVTALFLITNVQAQSLASLYNLQTLAGSDSVGDGGPASAALFIHIEGIAADSSGNIYVADTDDHRVRKITPAGIVSTLAGIGHPGFSGDGAPANSAELRTPYGVAVDRNGTVYIADLGNARIRRVTADGVISTFAGGGSTPAAQADGMPATQALLNSPRNVTVDSTGAVYFSDFGGQSVYQVLSSGTLKLLAGTGQAGYSGDGGLAVLAELSAPAGLTVDALGAVYIADSGNARVRKVYRGVISTLGDGGRSGAPPSIFTAMPTGLAMDSAGNLFIADPGENQILRVTPALVATYIAQAARDVALDAQGNLYACLGAIVFRRTPAGLVSAFAGGSAPSYLGDGGPALNALLQTPNAVARDRAGNLYIADTGHNRIRKVTPGGLIFTVAGDGVQGFAGDGGPAIAAQLNQPAGVAIASSGNVYIGDTGNQRIRIVDSAGNISTAAGSGVRGRSPDGTVAVRAQLDTPTWLALDSFGNLYFSETGNHSVRVLAVTGQLGTLAGNGTRGFSGDGGDATLATLDTPRGLAVDSSGNVYVADSGNRRIRYVTAPSASGPSIISTIPEPNAAIWRNLAGLAVDAQGSVYAADATDQRVFRMDPPGSILTIAGNGAEGFSGEAGPGLSETLDTPAGIVLDNTGNAYLADSNNGRIRMLTPASGALQTGPAAGPGLTLVNAASLQPGSIAPGELISIFGPGLGPAAGVTATQPSLQLGGTQVFFNGRQAPLTYVGLNQIDVQAPYSLGEVRPCVVQVVVNGVIQAQTQAQVADSAPAIFTVGGGSGQAAVLNEDGSYNSVDNPASRGSVVVLFATGEGQTAPAGIEGQPAGSPAPAPVLPVSLTIGGYRADLLYAAEAPGFAGLLQVNARVPAGFAPPGILPVTLQVGTATSPAGVTVAVQ